MTRRRARTMATATVTAVVVTVMATMALAISLAWPHRAAADGARPEVTAKLVKIPSKFPPDELYDYAYVMKYEVTDGPMKGQALLVAHYKPRQPRAKIDGPMKKHVAGSLKRFKEGDVHRMVLDPKLSKIWKGAVIDDFFAADRKTVRHWCLKVDLAR